MTATADDFRLPDYAHVPGHNERHAEGFLDTVIELAADPTSDKSAPANLAWMFGLRLMKEQYFWEAHEVLERVWMNAPPNSRERHLVQGVIHIANAALKLKMERPGAAKRLSVLAQECIGQAFSGGRIPQLMLLEYMDIFTAATQCSSSDFRFCLAGK